MILLIKDCKGTLKILPFTSQEPLFNEFANWPLFVKSLDKSVGTSMPCNVFT